MVFVVLLYRHYAVDDLVDVAEQYNVSFARLLSNTVWQDSSPILAADKPDPTRADEIERLDGVLRRLTANLSVLKVKIYNPDGLTIYSSEHAQIGELHSNSKGLSLALGQQEPQSELSRKDRFSAFSGEVFDLDLIETYVPVVNETGITTGVFEVYLDVTKIRDRIDHAVFGMVVGLSITFVLLYGILAFVVMGRAMAPLRLASARAADIGPTSSGERLPTNGMPSEVLPLIEAMNGALGRLDKALEAQRRFTADAAHELLTPLAVLTANLDTVKDKKQAKEIRVDVETISDIVAQLLELAELDSLGLTEAEPANLRDVCLEVTSMIAPLAYGQGKAIELTGSERAVMVRCNQKAVTRALRNLVQNAISHTPANTTVEVRVHDNGVIQVLDHGPGVPPDQRELIFRRFWRGASRAGPGAGLGLSIVKRAVETYGGTIEVSETPGGGATFTLSLPLVEDPAIVEI
jgi:signal transduction histidine kinase